MRPGDRWLISLPALLLLGACGQAPRTAEKAKEPPKPPEPVSAQWAFHQMYVYARSWAPDATPLRLASIELEQVPCQAGKCGAWEAVFVSPRLGRARRLTYSVLEAEGNLHKGVFAGLEESWTGPRGQAEPFPVSAFKVDATAAYETAMKKGADYAKKNPDMPITYLLEKTKRFPNPAWRVIWGRSIATSSYSIFVDASTGEYLATAR
ncbi:MAG: hypothetical protein RMI94_07025 [Bryobacterales bacterium]|nr:hypothetical protein [Bryobacteraceae bacterium]MDW8130285.1 hypothetical protein [Bryobacterales bacterium]